MLFRSLRELDKIREAGGVAFVINETNIETVRTTLTLLGEMK